MRFTVDVGYLPCLLVDPEYRAALVKTHQDNERSGCRLAAHESIASTHADIRIASDSDVTQAAYFFGVFTREYVLKVQNRVLKLQTQYWAEAIDPR